jgi:hypothetical protein
MHKKLDITSYGIMFIGIVAFCLICTTTSWLWWFSVIILPALYWFAYNAAPEPDPVKDYPLPTPEGVEVLTSVVLTDNNLAAAVLHVFPEFIQVITYKGFVKVEMHEFTQITMQDLSKADGPFSGFSLAYQRDKKEQQLLFAAPVSPWVTRGVAKLLLETYDAYYKGTSVPQLPYVEACNPHKVGMVHPTDSQIKTPIGSLN